MAAASKAKVMRTAYVTAFARAVTRKSFPPDIANDDVYAHHFLHPVQRPWAWLPRFSSWLMERWVPGAIGYFNARTRHFDAITLKALDDGVEQLVVLGAGFDTRGIRFADRLSGVSTFEVDMHLAVDLKRQIVSRVAMGSSEHVQQVVVDFETDDLYQKLRDHGYRREAKTLFLWEGVTYYLTPRKLEAMFAFFHQSSAPGSHVVFDYVTQAFTEGDHTSHGAGRLAAVWKRLGFNSSGIGSPAELVERFGMTLQSDLGGRELEERYLTSSSAASPRAWGAMRIAHARREDPRRQTQG